MSDHIPKYFPDIDVMNYTVGRPVEAEDYQALSQGLNRISDRLGTRVAGWYFDPPLDLSDLDDVDELKSRRSLYKTSNPRVLDDLSEDHDRLICLTYGFDVTIQVNPFNVSSGLDGFEALVPCDDDLKWRATEIPISGGGGGDFYDLRLSPSNEGPFGGLLYAIHFVEATSKIDTS